jgi:hypothetical protein
MTAGASDNPVAIAKGCPMRPKRPPGQSPMRLNGGDGSGSVRIEDVAGQLSDYLASEAGGGGTGRIISDAIFHSFATLIHSTITRNGLGVPSCPA